MVILLTLLGLAGCSRAVAEEEAALPTAAPTLVAKAATPTLAPTDPPAPTATPSPTATPTREYPPVAIDPGHGGEDLGARRWQDGHMVHTEAQVNLDLGLRLRDQLEARGIPAYLTRDGDYALLDPRVDINGSGDADYVDEAQARVDAINATDAVVMISLHQNAFEWPDGSLAPDVGGTVVYYCADRPFAEQSKRLADLVHGEIIGVFAEYGHDVRDRGVLDDAVLREAGEPGGHLIVLGPESVHIVRPVQIPGVLSETLFITHEVEGALAMDPVALDRFAQAYADAIQQYLDETLAND